MTCKHCQHLHQNKVQQANHCPCGCHAVNSHSGSPHYNEYEHFSKQLLEMADDAWMEVLKEKIKKNIEQTNGEALDALAKIVSDSNHERWKHKLSIQKSNRSFEEQLNKFFNK